MSHRRGVRTTRQNIGADSILSRPEANVHEVEYWHVNPRKKGGFRLRIKPTTSKQRQLFLRKACKLLQDKKRDELCKRQQLKKKLAETSKDSRANTKNSNTLNVEGEKANEDHNGGAQGPEVGVGGIENAESQGSKGKSVTSTKSDQDVSPKVSMDVERSVPNEKDNKGEEKNLELEGNTDEVGEEKKKEEEIVEEKSIEQMVEDLEVKLQAQQKQKHMLFINLKRVLMEEQKTKQKQREEETAREQAYIRARDSLLKESLDTLPASPIPPSTPTTPNISSPLSTPTVPQVPFSRSIFRPPFLAGRSTIMGFSRHPPPSTPTSTGTSTPKGEGSTGDSKGIRPTPIMLPRKPGAYPGPGFRPPPRFLSGPSFPSWERRPGSSGEQAGKKSANPDGSPAPPGGAMRTMIMPPIGIRGIDGRMVWRPGLLPPPGGLRAPVFPPRRPGQFMGGRRGLLGRPGVLLGAGGPPPHPMLLGRGRGRGRGPGFPPFPMHVQPPP
ncbi:hypothetical protein AAMO2058_000347700 [Amorphochlora amoebiformis]